MKSNKDIVEMVQNSTREFFEAESIRRWRTYEVRESYSVVDGSADGHGQWRREDYQQQIHDALPIVTINKVSPVIDAIVGFEIQNRTQVEYIPRVIQDEQQAEFTDRVQATAKYFERDSKAQFHESEAFRDLAICGVGCCDFDIDYMEPPHDGNLKETRLFPGFVGWDVNAREKNLLDANHVWQAKIVRREVAERRLKAKGKLTTDIRLGGSVGNSASTTTEFLEFFDLNTNISSDLDVIYLYQWREESPFWKIANPFLDPNLVNDPLIMNYVAQAEGLYGFNASDATLNIDGDDYKAFKKDLEFFGVEPEGVKLEKWRYYRAEVIGDTLVEKAENMSQKGFSQKFMTGKYSPIDQMYFGAVRAMKSPQRLYNKSVSSIQGFLDNMVMNGVNIEDDAVHDLKQFVDTYPRSRGKGVTVFKKGALTNQQVQQKNPSTMPQGFMEMIGLSGQSVMDAPGVTPSFMGLADSSDETGVLYSQKVRQGMTVLAWLMDAKRLFMLEKGKLYIDATKILAENNPGRPIYNYDAEDGNDRFFRLFDDGIAEEYDVIIDDAPLTPDENERVFAQFMQLSEKMPQLAALAMDFAPLDKKQRELAKQAIMPPPPPQPNPLEVGMIEAETASKTESANLNRAKAEKEKILTLQEIEKLKNGTFEEVAEAPDPSAAYDLADKAARYELDKRKIDLDEAKTAADIAERDERLKLDSRKLDMEERRLTLDAHKMQSEREIKHKEVAVKEKAASRRKTNESRTNA